jgi:hypothetical protein
MTLPTGALVLQPKVPETPEQDPEVGVNVGVKVWVGVPGSMVIVGVDVNVGVNVLVGPPGV